MVHIDRITFVGTKRQGDDKKYVNDLDGAKDKWGGGYFGQVAQR